MEYKLNEGIDFVLFLSIFSLIHPESIYTVPDINKEKVFVQ